MKGYILKDSYDTIKELSTLKKKIVDICEIGDYLVNSNTEKDKLRAYSEYVLDWCNDIQIYTIQTNMRKENPIEYKEYIRCFNTLFNHSEDLMDSIILYG